MKMEIKINTQFKNIRRWEDSRSRTEHVLDRMSLRGVGINEIREAVAKGAKTFREDSSIIAKYSWYSVVYREFRLGKLRKIYPITVMSE